MNDADFTGCVQPWVVREPKQRYKTKSSPLDVKEATVHKQYYLHPIKANPSGSGRPIPWINLNSFWLEQAGFAIGTPYTIEVYEGKLVFIVAE